MSERDSDRGLHLRSIRHTFHQGGQDLEILKEISFAVAPGEMVALVGPSGAGKSTLLHIAGLLEQPTGGEIVINGKAAGKLNDAGRTALRRQDIGFVYQFHHLLPEFSALENLVLPQMIGGTSRSAGKARAQELLEAVGLANRATHRPARLSGGEQQRVAIARGLANTPSVLLADEPTGNLDPDTADSVFDILEQLVRSSEYRAI